MAIEIAKAVTVFAKRSSQAGQGGTCTGRRTDIAQLRTNGWRIIDTDHLNRR